MRKLFLTVFLVLLAAWAYAQNPFGVIQGPSGTLTTGSVTSAHIADNAIKNVDVASDAAIATSKISGLGTIATQNSDNVLITGGSISGVTLATTGDVSGAVPTFTVTDNTTLTRSTHTMTAMVFVDNVARTITLPEVVASPGADQVKVGSSFCVQAIGAVVVDVAPHANDGIRLSGSTSRGANGTAIYSSGTAGDQVCLVADNAAGWSTTGTSGTWTSR